MPKYVMALYIRLSIEDIKYDSLSIENQRLVLNEYAESMPEAADCEIIEFVDNGYSGTNFERPQVQKLIEMVKSNQIDCILVKDFSRFGRNSIETGYFIERVFPLFHTRFISLSDDYDSDRFKGDTGGMDVAFKYLISEYYSKDMSIKSKTAKYAKMERGEYQSKICQYGYRKSADGRIEPDPEAASVVQLIFQLSAERMSATDITRELFRHKIPTPGEYKAARGNHSHDISRTDGTWSVSTVLRILEDERYTGTYVIGKRAVIEIGSNRSRLKDRDKWFIIPDHHPAIVSKELFEKANENQLRYKLPHKISRDYLLKGKAFCGCCHHALSRTMNKTPYFSCRHSIANENSPCHNMRIKSDELEQAVFLTIKKQFEVFEPNKIEDTRVCEVIPEKEGYEHQIDELLECKMALYEKYQMGEIDLKTYMTEKTVFDDLIQQTKNACAVIMAQAKANQAEREYRDNRQEVTEAIQDADTLTHDLVDLLIERVDVFPENRIEVSYKAGNLFG